MIVVLVRFRRASDTRAVRRVARAAWRAALEGHAPAGFLAAVWRTLYGRDRLVLGLLDVRRDAIVAERDGRVIGYADGIAGAGADGPAAAYDLARVYVEPRAWGGGVGRALVESLLMAARARGVARVDVEVDAANGAGLRWWERLGFARAGAGTYELPPWSRPTIRLVRSAEPLAWRRAPRAHPDQPPM